MATIFTAGMVTAVNGNGKSFWVFLEQPDGSLRTAVPVPWNERDARTKIHALHQAKQVLKVQETVPWTQRWVVDDEARARVGCLPADFSESPFDIQNRRYGGKEVCPHIENFAGQWCIHVDNIRSGKKDRNGLKLKSRKASGIATRNNLCRLALRFVENEGGFHAFCFGNLQAAHRPDESWIYRGNAPHGFLVNLDKRCRWVMGDLSGQRRETSRIAARENKRGMDFFGGHMILF